MAQRNFQWTAEKERAVGLLADGVSHRDIAKLGISRKSIERWKRHPEFIQRLQDLIGTAREQAQRMLLGRKESRIQILEDLYSRQRAIIDERSADPEMQAVPGGKTGLLIRKSVVSSGTVISYEYLPDTRLTSEIRKTLQQIALEAAEGPRNAAVQAKAEDDPFATALAKLMNADEIMELQRRMESLKRDGSWSKEPDSTMFTDNARPPDFTMNQ